MVSAGAFAAAAALAISAPAQADLLDDIKARGVLKCGIHSGKTGFAIPDASGRWEGLDVDYCRALAAAVLADQDKVELITVSAKNRFTALSSGEIDVLSRTTTVTATRDGRAGVDFTLPLFLDGQGFLVRKDLGVAKVSDLNGATICVNPGTTTEKNLNDYFQQHGLSYKALVIEGDEETTKAFIHARCDAFTGDRSAVAARRLALPNPSDSMILDEVGTSEKPFAEAA